MGMYVHIDVEPTIDAKISKVKAWANYVDHHGESHAFTVYEDKIINPEYSDSRTIEHWLITTFANMSSAVASAMLGRLARDQLLVIPPVSEQPIS